MAEAHTVSAPAREKDPDHQETFTATPARPPHSHTESNLAPTSEFTRYVLVWLPSRYTFRALSQFAFDYIHHVKFLRPISDAINGWLTHRYVNPMADKINAKLKENFSEEFWKIAAEHQSKDATVERIGAKLGVNGSAENKLYHDVNDIIQKGKFGFGHEDGKIIQHAYDRSERITGKSHGLETKKNALEITTTARERLLKTVRTNMWHAAYSRFLGGAFILLASSYALKVYKDLKHVFSETVAMETGKKQEDISFWDIKNSSNRIVEKSTSNFFWRTFERSVMSVPLFFVSRFLPRVLPDFMVGAMGLKIFSETWNRKITMFEDLVGFINNKINPQNGLGQPITTSDIFDLYQHYSFQYAKDKAFNNVIEHDVKETRAWGKSQLLFSRIAELMNLTYAYKHATKYDADGKPVRQADFALPKFIYLLGHDLIDGMNPERSLVYVELANAKGIDAVKAAKAAFAMGASADEVAKEHGIKLPQPTQPSTTVHADQPKPTGTNLSTAMQDAPQSKVSAVRHQMLQPSVDQGLTVAS